jgi:hypothetical protein
MVVDNVVNVNFVHKECALHYSVNMGKGIYDFDDIT